jgi:hypothetical protein
MQKAGSGACPRGHNLIAMLPRLRQATTLDLPRISEVRHGTAENRLEDPSLVTPAEVDWYLNEAIFLVSEDEAGIQGFLPAQTIRQVTFGRCS